MSMLIIRTIVVASLLAAPPAPADEIRHRFLAVDESRHQLLHVDQRDPAKDWILKLPVKHRDVQLAGGGIVLLSSQDGYREYRLADQKLVKEVSGFPGAVTARRQPDGRTVLACNQQGVTIYELSPDDKPLRKANFKVAGTRLVRLTPKGTFLFGSHEQVFEGDWSGKTLATFTLPKGAWVYQALRRPDGHLLCAGGYIPTLYELDAAGQVVKTTGGPPAPEAKPLGLHFFAGMQVLNSGHIVVSNWTGHGASDSSKGVQLVEYTPEGQLVWKWHDPERAGSIDGVIVLDDLDPAVLNDDVSSVLSRVGR